jgi:alanine-glyoxylate transaminase/serine-glyoxylate transaminase/serine-pyruvate transaminase
MAPGPSNIHPRVQRALIAPLVGHKDAYFLGLLEQAAALLRKLFQTRNEATLALPTSGGGGMEAALVNLIEPGDTVVIGDAGFFAHRMVEITGRLPEVKVIVVDGEWGRPIDVDRLIAAIHEHHPRVVAVVHGETSTGVEQPLVGIGAACHQTGALLVVDAVATLGGVNLPVDELEIDICFSGSQKCLSAPPGLAPITVSDRAMAAIERRRTPVQSWYLDLALHARLWATEHIYHHTSPVLNIYALFEALRVIEEEGLDRRFARHCLHAEALRTGLAALGVRELATAHKLPSVVTALAPPGVSAHEVRDDLLEDLNLEVSTGLGAYADSMWRIGVMGHSAQRANVLLVLNGLEHALGRRGHTAKEAPIATASAVYDAAAAMSP